MNPPLIATNAATYRSRKDVHADVLALFWDSKPFSQRECVVPAPAVTADVNGHLVSFEYDNYGRLFQAQVV
jgi:hypothetical protein